MLLVIGAFVGVLVTGTSTNQPVLRVAVAVRDLAVGERLTESDFRIVDQIIDPALARLYIQAADVPVFLGAPAIDVIRRGDPLNRIKFAADDDAAQIRRYTLVLTDANDVLMTIPVDPDLIPPDIAPGDMINVLFIAGDESGTRQLPERHDSATATPTASTIVGSLPQDLPTPAPFEAFGSREVPTPTVSSATEHMALPMADVMLQRVPVVDVTRKQVQNPAYTGAQTDSAQPYIDGAISSIVVRVPREAQTLLGFGIATSKLRFTIVSPLASVSDVQPDLGMDWHAYMTFYSWKQQLAIARGGSLRVALYPSLSSTAAPTRQPTAISTATERR
jgi:hypothetical protein